MNVKQCSVNGCDRKQLAKGFCEGHYRRNKTGHAMEAPFRKIEIHGMTNTPYYHIWSAMIERCSSPNNKAWANYGGRGIKVCDKWKGSFSNFYKDMGDRPEGFTLERKDNDKGYSPDNCKWASRVEQASNRRMQSNNKTGIAGVIWSMRRKAWISTIMYNNQACYIGQNKDFFEACCVRKSAENKVRIVL